MKYTSGMIDNELEMCRRAAKKHATEHNEVFVVVEVEQGLHRYGVLPFMQYQMIPLLRRPKSIYTMFPKQSLDYSNITRGSADTDDSFEL